MKNKVNLVKYSYRGPYKGKIIYNENKINKIKRENKNENKVYNGKNEKKGMKEMMQGMDVREYRLLRVVTKERRKAYQVEYGRSGLQHLIDLQDHNKVRPAPASVIRNRFWYGEEWARISKAVREASEGICEGCGMGWGISQLAVHHRTEISRWMAGVRENNLKYGDEITTHGVKTHRPWHAEENLQVLCKDCHADKHDHMTGTGERDERKPRKVPQRVGKKKKKKRVRRWHWDLGD